MNGLICKKALIELIEERNRNTCNGSLSCLQMKRMAENIPTADAVEVVRCKDCRFYEEAESSLIGKVMCCTGQGDVRIQKQANDFCSYGERKNDGICKEG